MRHLKVINTLKNLRRNLCSAEIKVMDTLKNKKLLNKTGTLEPAEKVLEGKDVIMYYFSASWCKPCQLLLPKIKRVYEENLKRNSLLEIIYISLDDEEPKMMQYFQENHGKWYAMPFGDTTAYELRLKYHVTHIPQITVVKPDGTIIAKDGRKDIEELGINVLVTWVE